jgi:rhamnose transport system substrate-binding protein
MKGWVRRSAVVASLSALALFASACSSDSGTSTSSEETETSVVEESVVDESGGSEEAASEDLPEFWYINVLTSYDLYNQAQALFEQAAGDIGYIANATGSATVDIPAQITQINQAAASGAKAIIYCNLDPATYQSTIKDAQAQGIVMITTGGCVDDYSDYSIGTDNVTFGEVAAQTIADDVGPDAKIIVYATNEAVPNQVAQINSFKDFAAANFPDMEVVSVQYTDADAATAATRIGAAVSAYPEANAFWFVEGAGVSAVPKALEQAGKKPGEIYVLGVDSTPETLQSVADGWLSSTLAQCFFYATPFAAELAKLKLAGEGPTQQSWPVGVVPVGPSDLPFAGCPESAYPSLN